MTDPSRVAVQRVLDYIDEHITEKLTGEELAGQAAFSLYHFYRLFSRQVGLSVMTYVTRRKLQYALYELARGEKVLDIALKYGFETHAGFSKAFKKHFGYPPNYYRMHAPVDVPRRVDLEALELGHTGGIILQPKIVERDAFCIAGYGFETTLKNNTHARDIPAFWDQCNIQGKEEKLYRTQETVRHGEYGICVPPTRGHESFLYVLGVEVVSFDALLEEMTPFEVPPATYAVFTTPAVEEEVFSSSIRGTWRYILDEWFPNSDYAIDERVMDFEYYDERSHPWDQDLLSMEIHIPIVLQPKE